MQHLKRIAMGAVALLVLGLAFVQFGGGAKEPEVNPYDAVIARQDYITEQVNELRQWRQADHERIVLLQSMAHKHAEKPSVKPDLTACGKPSAVPCITFPKH